VNKVAERTKTAASRWQSVHPPVAVIYGVVKKFSDDDVNQFVVALGWYGFVAIYPLLLVAVSVLGFIGAASLGHSLVNTLHQFPVVGSQFNPAHGGSAGHGSTLGLVIGLAALVYGAQGVTQTAQRAMVRVWNIPRLEVPSYFSRLARSLTGLAIIGTAFVGNAALATLATGSGRGLLDRIAVIVAMVVVNVALYLAAFRALTPSAIPLGVLWPGATVAATGFTLLITVGSGLIQHQVRNSSATYGQFGIVIGLVAFLFLVAKISLYGAELNPVLARHYWPRGIGAGDPTEADDRVLRAIAHQSLSRPDQRIGVGFGETAQRQVSLDALTGQPVGPDDARPVADQPNPFTDGGDRVGEANETDRPGRSTSPSDRGDATMVEHTEPDAATNRADQVQPEHTADRPATEEESAVADEHYGAEDPERLADVARHEKEMMEIGAKVKGEGSIE
jgi:uncharacterized BrkB/YihY/UPF0761 family membrane protein